MEKPRHLTYPNVMSTLAVFLAVAGGSVAIANVPNDSVDSGKVIDESLRSEDLKDAEAVKSSDVVNGELVGSDIATDAVGSSEIANGAVGSSAIPTSAVGGSEVATDSVSSLELSTSAVGASEILNGSVTGTEVADGQIDADEIGADNIYRVEDGGQLWNTLDNAHNGDYQLEDDTADCGTGELLAGGVKWDDNNDEEKELFVSEIRLNLETDVVTVVGGNDSGTFHTLRAEAICLAH